MSIIYFLIGCSVLLALIFLAAFFWAQRSGQNDDLYTPSMRMLLDDESDLDTPHANDEHNKVSTKK